MRRAAAAPATGPAMIALREVSTAAVQGECALQGVTFDGTTLAYGNKNGLQPVETVTLTANAPVTIGTAQVVNQTGTAFSKGSDSCSGQSLAVGQTCTIQINFNAPQGNSARSGQLQVPYTGVAGGPAVLGLTGS